MMLTLSFSGCRIRKRAIWFPIAENHLEAVHLRLLDLPQHGKPRAQAEHAVGPALEHRILQRQPLAPARVVQHRPQQNRGGVHAASNGLLHDEVADVGRGMGVEAREVWLWVLARAVQNIVVCRSQVLQVVVGCWLAREGQPGHSTANRTLERRATTSAGRVRPTLQRVLMLHLLMLVDRSQACHIITLSLTILLLIHLRRSQVLAPLPRRMPRALVLGDTLARLTRR